jgi:HPt (histidine-containing phosphotransfer) domain-containing protein
MFEERARADFEQLKRYVAAGDAKETARLAHTLKGTAAYIAGAKLGGIARQIEEMALLADLRRADACLAELCDELTRCLDFIPTALETVAGNSTRSEGMVNHANPGR